MKQWIRRKVLMWLFETEDIEKYFNILSKYVDEIKEHRDAIQRHLNEIEEHLGTLRLLRKVLTVCQNHSIDIDKEVAELKETDNESVNENN
jgi:hypothetical protein